MRYEKVIMNGEHVWDLEVDCLNIRQSSIYLERLNKATKNSVRIPNNITGI